MASEPASSDYLFPEAGEPWDVHEPNTPDEVRRHREVLLALLAVSALGTLQAKVASLLKKHPETRDSDTALAIKFWRVYEPRVLADTKPFALEVLYNLTPIESITRARRRIQNTLGLFQGSLRTQAFRGEIQTKFYQYIASQQESASEVRFYLDETGNDPASNYSGVGGLCVIDSNYYDMYHAVLRKWRRELERPQPFHFTDASSTDEHEYLRLITQIEKHRSGLLFAGYAFQTVRNPMRAIRNLFLQLVVDSIELLDNLGCLNVPRTLVLFKEEEVGFDRFELPTLEADLSQRLYERFPGKIRLKGVTPLPKGKDILLECADAIAGSMHRRATKDRHIHKDRIADAVLRVTGLGDESADGAVFKVFRD